MRDTGSPRRYAIAGASGLVGGALAHRLAADPATVALHLLLRRQAPALVSLPHVQVIAWPGGAVPRLPPIDTAICALGTTIKSAGSQAAFRAVDFEAVLDFARAARTAEATCFAVISALGADAGSPVFYNRVKGEMEQALRALGFPTLVIARPSLLLGDRVSLGQAPRLGETLAQNLAPWLTWMTPRRLRPIKADDLAGGLLAALVAAPAGVRVIESDELQRLSDTVTRPT